MAREILPVIWSGPCTDECQLLENIYKVEYQSDYFYEQISIFFSFFPQLMFLGPNLNIYFFVCNIFIVPKNFKNDKNVCSSQFLCFDTH